MKLQLLLDLVQQPVLKKLSQERHVQLLLFMHEAKSTDKLKQIIGEACKLILPREVYDGVENYIKMYLDKMPDKGKLSRFKLSA